MTQTREQKNQIADVMERIAAPSATYVQANAASPWAVSLIRHGQKAYNEQHPSPIVFMGRFSECWAFVDALDLVKPKPSAAIMGPETTPYQLVISSAGISTLFHVKSTGGKRSVEVVFEGPAST